MHIHVRTHLPTHTCAHTHSASDSEGTEVHPLPLTGVSEPSASPSAVTIKNGFSPSDFTPQCPSQSSHHLAQPCVRGAGLVHTSILSDSEASHVMVVVVVGGGIDF